jgi:hypothetical protein
MAILNCVGGVVVSVLSTGSKVRGFKPRRDRFLRAINRSTPSVKQEVKGRSYVVRFYSMLKIRWCISDANMQNSHSFVHSSYSLPDISAGRITRELWCTRQEFYPAGIIIIISITTTMALHAHISPGVWTIGPFVGAVSRRLTPSTWSISQSINQSINGNLSSKCHDSRSIPN